MGLEGFCIELCHQDFHLWRFKVLDDEFLVLFEMVVIVNLGDSTEDMWPGEMMNCT